MNQQVATKVVAYWDEQDPKNEGWYYEASDAEGNYVNDSAKIDSPVDPDDFGRDDGDALLVALVGAYPDAEVEIR